MTFKEFIGEFDFPNSIILLEGKRQVKELDKERLMSLGRLLAASTSHMIFRSGNASGTDQLFSEGVASVDHKRLQVLTPYTGHRQRTNQAYDTISLNDVTLTKEPGVIYESKKHRGTQTLIDNFVAGRRDRLTIKAAYIIRDTIKAIGTSEIPPASFGIFYDDLDNPMSGGTGHTMNVCTQNGIPTIDQKVWFRWLSE
jgi:hypothetical protein